MSYAYAGNHTGPDSFDTCTGVRNGHTQDTVTPYLVAEREAQMAYWYARDLNDAEIAQQIGIGSDAVLKWRHRHNYPTNT